MGNFYKRGYNRSNDFNINYFNFKMKQTKLTEEQKKYNALLKSMAKSLKQVKSIKLKIVKNKNALT